MSSLAPLHSSSPVGPTQNGLIQGTEPHISVNPTSIASCNPTSDPTRSLTTPSTKIRHVSTNTHPHQLNAHPHLGNEYSDEINQIFHPQTESKQPISTNTIERLKNDKIIDENGKINFSKLGVSSKDIHKAKLSGTVYFADGEIQVEISGNCGPEATKILHALKEKGVPLTIDPEAVNINDADRDILMHGGQIQMKPLQNGKMLKLTLDPGKNGNGDGLTLSVFDKGKTTRHKKIPLSVVFGGQAFNGVRVLENGHPILEDWQRQNLFERSAINVEKLPIIPFVHRFDVVTLNNTNDVDRIQSENRLWSAVYTYLKAVETDTPSTQQATHQEDNPTPQLHILQTIPEDISSSTPESNTIIDPQHQATFNASTQSPITGNDSFIGQEYPLYSTPAETDQYESMSYGPQDPFQEQPLPPTPTISGVRGNHGLISEGHQQSGIFHNAQPQANTIEINEKHNNNHEDEELVIVHKQDSGTKPLERNTVPAVINEKPELTPSEIPTRKPSEKKRTPTALTEKRRGNELNNSTVIPPTKRQRTNSEPSPQKAQKKTLEEDISWEEEMPQGRNIPGEKSSEIIENSVAEKLPNDDLVAEPEPETVSIIPEETDSRITDTLQNPGEKLPEQEVTDYREPNTQPKEETPPEGINTNDLKSGPTDQPVETDIPPQQEDKDITPTSASEVNPQPQGSVDSIPISNSQVLEPASSGQSKETKSGIQPKEETPPEGIKEPEPTGQPVKMNIPPLQEDEFTPINETPPSVVEEITQLEPETVSIIPEETDSRITDTLQNPGEKLPEQFVQATEEVGMKGSFAPIEEAIMYEDQALISVERESIPAHTFEQKYAEYIPIDSVNTQDNDVPPPANTAQTVDTTKSDQGINQDNGLDTNVPPDRTTTRTEPANGVPAPGADQQGSTQTSDTGIPQAQETNPNNGLDNGIPPASTTSINTSADDVPGQMVGQQDPVKPNTEPGNDIPPSLTDADQTPQTNPTDAAQPVDTAKSAQVAASDVGQTLELQQAIPVDQEDSGQATVKATAIFAAGIGTPANATDPQALLKAADGLDKAFQDLLDTLSTADNNPLIESKISELEGQIDTLLNQIRDPQTPLLEDAKYHLEGAKARLEKAREILNQNPDLNGLRTSLTDQLKSAELHLKFAKSRLNGNNTTPSIPNSGIDSVNTQTNGIPDQIADQQDPLAASDVGRTPESQQAIPVDQEDSRQATVKATAVNIPRIFAAGMGTPANATDPQALLKAADGLDKAFQDLLEAFNTGSTKPIAQPVQLDTLVPLLAAARNGNVPSGINPTNKKAFIDAANNLSTAIQGFLEAFDVDSAELADQVAQMDKLIAQLATVRTGNVPPGINPANTQAFIGAANNLSTAIQGFLEALNADNTGSVPTNQQTIENSSISTQPVDQQTSVDSVNDVPPSLPADPTQTIGATETEHGADQTASVPQQANDIPPPANADQTDTTKTDNTTPTSATTTTNLQDKLQEASEASQKFIEAINTVSQLATATKGSFPTMSRNTLLDAAKDVDRAISDLLTASQPNDPSIRKQIIDIREAQIKALDGRINDLQHEIDNAKTQQPQAAWISKAENQLANAQRCLNKAQQRLDDLKQQTNNNLKELDDAVKTQIEETAKFLDWTLKLLSDPNTAVGQPTNHDVGNTTTSVDGSVRDKINFFSNIGKSQHPQPNPVKTASTTPQYNAVQNSMVAGQDDTDKTDPIATNDVPPPPPPLPGTAQTTQIDAANPGQRNPNPDSAVAGQQGSTQTVDTAKSDSVAPTPQTIQQLQTQIDDFQNQINEAEAQIKDLQAQINAAKTQEEKPFWLNDAERTLNKASENLNTAKETLNNANGRVKANKSELAAHWIDASRESLKTANSWLARTKAHMNLPFDPNSTTQVTQAKLTSDITQPTQDRINEMQGQIKDLQAQIDKAEKQNPQPNWVNNAKRTLNNARKNLNNAQENLNNATKESHYTKGAFMLMDSSQEALASTSYWLNRTQWWMPKSSVTSNSTPEVQPQQDLQQLQTRSNDDR